MLQLVLSMVTDACFCYNIVDIILGLVFFLKL